MLRISMDAQKCTIPQVDSVNPLNWPESSILADNFWGFDSHGYKGYYYFTGSDFPSPKKTIAKAAFTSNALLVSVDMEEPDIALVMENIKNNKLENLQADHITLNLITANGDRLMASVNPVGQLYAENNLQRGIEPFFHAEVAVGSDYWNVLFAIPLAVLDSKDGLWFDIVRQEQGSASVNTLTRAAITPPYNYIYEYPIFHFLPLYFGQEGNLTETRFTEGCKCELIAGNEVTAGEYVEPVIKVTAGEYGLEPGGRIRLSHGAPVLNCGVMWSTPLDWQEVQVTNPKGAGYLHFDGADFAIETNGIYSEATYTGKEKLPSGTEILIRIGDRTQGGPGIKASVVTCPDHGMYVNVDLAGKGVFEPLERPRINIKSGPAVQLIVTNPGAVPGDAEFELVVRAVDHYGNICPDFTDTVVLSCDADECDFPCEIKFTPEDQGVKVIAGKIASTGIYRFYARGAAISGQGNFVATDGSFGDGWILYGDMHCHTCTSDGWKTPEEKVVESRHLRGLQFMALADHDFDQSPEKWQHYQDLACSSTEAGRFISFLAHEWTPSAGYGKNLVSRNVHGHYVVLYPELTGDLIRANDPQSCTPEGLFAEARKQPGVMVIPHYHGSRPPVDPEISCAIEVAAWDGKICDEHTNNNDNKDLFGTLNEGFNLAVIAGVDHGGEGLTAFRNGEMFSVRADEFSRTAILDGIRRRETTAIQHSRSLLNFTLNGNRMGSVVELDKSVPRKLEVKLACDPSAIHVQVIRNGKKIYNYPNAILCKGPILDFEYTDNAPEVDSDWYLIRVILHGGEILWSSPIRVNS